MFINKIGVIQRSRHDRKTRENQNLISEIFIIGKQNSVADAYKVEKNKRKQEGVTSDLFNLKFVLQKNYQPLFKLYNFRSRAIIKIINNIDLFLKYIELRNSEAYSF